MRSVYLQICHRLVGYASAWRCPLFMQSAFHIGTVRCHQRLCPPFLFLVVPQLDIVYWVFAPGRPRHRLAPCIPRGPSAPWMNLLRNFE